MAKNLGLESQTTLIKHFPGNGKPETKKNVRMTDFSQNGRRDDHKTGFKFPHPSKGLPFQKD